MPDTGVDGVILCAADAPCPEGMRCVSGICETGQPSTDAGVEPSLAELEICTLEGCEPPWRVNFGGSRIDLATAQTIVLRSVGAAPLEIQNVEIRNRGTEFEVDPSGDLDLVLQPSEELVVQVVHRARDGLEDDEELEIISNAERVRSSVRLVTEYKGVPDLLIGEDPSSNMGQTQLIDFGNVRLGVSESRTAYLKNRDPVIDGSILTIDEVRLDPVTSTNFELNLDRVLPAQLSQFSALCANDSACLEAQGDSCDAALGVCRTAAGPIRDVLSAEITFIGTTPGLIEERVLVSSTDGGQDSIRTVLVRANVSNGVLEVDPDPIDFPEGFLGYTQDQAVTLSNAGTGPVTITSIALTSTEVFSLDLGGLSFPLVLGTQDVSTLQVSFAPSVVGTFSSVLELQTDDVERPITSVSVTGAAFDAPVLELNPSTVDFGDTHSQVGGMPSATVVVTARNAGGHELRIPQLSMLVGSAIGFSVDPSALPPLAAGQTASFNVRYSPLGPTFPNIESGSVEVHSNDPATAPILLLPLTGRGVNPNAFVLPGNQVNFNDLQSNPNTPQIYQGQTITERLTILNGGTGPLQVSNISTQGDARGAFSFAIIGGLVPPFELAQGDNFNVDVTYQAPGPGTDGATLQFDTNDLDLPGGLLLANLVGSTSACPAMTGAIGLSDASGSCVYSCDVGFIDLDNDLNQPGSNGCEYGCVFMSVIDLPDDSYADENCDGVDGLAADAIFVSVTGSDVNPGTPALPMRTVSAGLAAASAQARDVYISAGVYNEPSTITLLNGVSIYGGYSASSWAIRSIADTAQIVVDAPTAMSASGLAQVTVLDHLNVRGRSTVVAGASAYGIFAVNSDGLVVRQSTIVAGSGGDGADATSPSGVAASGTPGAGGRPGCEESGGFCSGCSRPQGGLGGNSSCGRSGGRGGSAGRDDAWGNPGGAGAGGTPGGPGTPDDGGNWNTPSTYWGQNGANGGAGTGGAAGVGQYSVSGYAPTSGTSGGVGAHGNGGGGGGGGGGGDDSCDSYGGGGGGGGGGGCGGQGAPGGSSAGGSIAIYLWGSDATIELCTLQTGDGGAGGNGGNGQPGGNGGAGGWGGNAARPGAGNPYGGGGEQDDGSNGGRGGTGGNGGQGGHGGGGAGGAVIGVVLGGGSNASALANTFVLGTPGAGGASLGNPGPTGVLMQTHTP